MPQCAMIPTSNTIKVRGFLSGDPNNEQVWILNGLKPVGRQMVQILNAISNKYEKVRVLNGKRGYVVPNHL